ncbi:MAG: NrsF family protein [Novosphingobium sp.]|nr:NrsF family protein [Novosphingobium sp.]
MTSLRTDSLIDRLAAGVAPVRPLPAPELRALMALATIVATAALAVAWFGDFAELRNRYSGRETHLALEMAAILATAAIAIVAAFFVSIPGRSKRWIAAPIPFFAGWLLVTGLGCYGNLGRGGGVEWELGESLHCLAFIVATSAALAPLLVWRLACARPIDPLPVALLAGLGVAASSAFVLQFFHPFTVTFIDLAVHLTAILVVVGTVGLLNRHTLVRA